MSNLVKQTERWKATAVIWKEYSGRKKRPFQSDSWPERQWGGAKNGVNNDLQRKSVADERWGKEITRGQTRRNKHMNGDTCM